jgi:transcriptional regulator with XRE-family HTH domain
MEGINYDLKILSENIRRYRKQKQLTQKQLADHMDCSQKVISHWENLDKGYKAPSYERLLQLSHILEEPVAHLSGAMFAHDYTTQAVAEYLGIDPAAVGAIRELSGFEPTGSGEKLLDYSRALSALLVELNTDILNPFYDLIEASWGVVPVDDYRDADRLKIEATAKAEKSRFAIWSALDTMLRDEFAVPDQVSFYTAKAKEAVEIDKDIRSRWVHDLLQKNDSNMLSPSTAAAFLKFAKRLGNFTEERELVRRRLSGRA